MKRLHYGGGTTIVSDGVGEALLDYALALSRAGESAIASVPGGVDDPRSWLLLSPTSQLMMVGIEMNETTSTADDIAIENLTAQIDSLRAQHAHRYLTPDERAPEDSGYAGGSFTI